MAKFIVNSIQSLSDAIGKLTEAFNKDKYVTVSISSGKRMLTMDALAHVFYKQIAEHETQHSTPERVKSECKLEIGLPILALDDELGDYIETIRHHLKPLMYEERINAMKYFKVTSLMSVEQESHYIEQMQLIYSEDGIILESNRKK